MEGKYTNHSLRATCATRMFEAGIDEQLIKTFTGHKSDSVCDYKRVNDGLLRKANNAVTSRKSATCTQSSQQDCLSLETPPKKRKQNENSNPSPHNDDDVQYVEQVLKGPPTKAHGEICPLTAEKGHCTNLCSVLKKIDKKVESNAKKVKFMLKFESE